MTDNVEATLVERGSRYGDFSDHAVIAQDLQDVMRTQRGWMKLDAVKKQALTVIADKIARILNGDPEYRDNWHDIQGYAKLAEDRCTITVAGKLAEDRCTITVAGNGTITRNPSPSVNPGFNPDLAPQILPVGDGQ